MQEDFSELLKAATIRGRMLMNEVQQIIVNNNINVYKVFVVDCTNHFYDSDLIDDRVGMMLNVVKTDSLKDLFGFCPDKSYLILDDIHKGVLSHRAYIRPIDCQVISVSKGVYYDVIPYDYDNIDSVSKEVFDSIMNGRVEERSTEEGISKVFVPKKNCNGKFE